MLLKRNKPQSWAETIRISLWPRKSWWRSSLYVVKRAMRLNASAHAIAAGMATGVFVSFTPFIGTHFILAFVIAYIIRGNMLAAALGTFAGNPITFFFIWPLTYEIGIFILNIPTDLISISAFYETMIDAIHAIEAGNFRETADIIAKIWKPVMYPMVIGSAVLGPMFAIPIYLVTKKAAEVFKKKHKKRIAEKAKAIRKIIATQKIRKIRRRKKAAKVLRNATK